MFSSSWRQMLLLASRQVVVVAAFCKVSHRPIVSALLRPICYADMIVMMKCLCYIGYLCTYHFLVAMFEFSDRHARHPATRSRQLLGLTGTVHPAVSPDVLDL